MIFQCFLVCPPYKTSLRKQHSLFEKQKYWRTNSGSFWFASAIIFDQGNCFWQTFPGLPTFGFWKIYFKQCFKRVSWLPNNFSCFQTCFLISNKVFCFKQCFLVSLVCRLLALRKMAIGNTNVSATTTLCLPEALEHFHSLYFLVLFLHIFTGKASPRVWCSWSDRFQRSCRLGPNAGHISTQ